MGTFIPFCHIYSMNTSDDNRTNVNNLWITLNKNKGYEMKFKRYYNDKLTYLIWERYNWNFYNSGNVVITKRRGTKEYKLENLSTNDFYIFDNLQEAKNIGSQIWLND